MWVRWETKTKIYYMFSNLKFKTSHFRFGDLPRIIGSNGIADEKYILQI